MATCDLTVYTIGHSDHSVEEFIALLRRYHVALLVDVRSQPYSRWVHQFNRELLVRELQNTEIGYHYMGNTLGGRPEDPLERREIQLAPPGRQVAVPARPRTPRRDHVRHEHRRRALEGLVGDERAREPPERRQGDVHRNSETATCQGPRRCAESTGL